MAQVLTFQMPFLSRQLGFFVQTLASGVRGTRARTLSVRRVRDHCMALVH